jgi:predicted AlkP superfamily pyrophosphatase or phosphodiesterase
MKRSVAFVVVLVLSTISLLESAERPRLVVYISIDQMKAEYLSWYKSEFTGAFKRFLTEGADFTNADLNYALSETGPGHAALGTGAYPMHSGIPSNEWLNPMTRKRIYCVGDSTAEKVDSEGGGFSPRNLVVTGIGDWLKESSPTSKVIAISLKDRAAILMGGRHPDCAYWYDQKSGHMVTSDYYVHTLPDWVTAFNQRDWVLHRLPDAWRKLLPDRVYAKYGPDKFRGELKWDGSTSFPHPFTLNKKREQIVNSPYGDQMTLDFAQEAIRSEKLGQRGVSDLLLVSLSCTDYIGHAFGGNSQEMLDNLIRLDRSLGDFIAEAEKLVGHGNILVALSADHGAMPLPEYRRTVQHRGARRFLVQKELYPEIQILDRKLQKEFNTSEHIILANAFLNYGAAQRANIDSLGLERRVRNGILKIDGIVDVFFRRELVNTKTRHRPYLGYFQRGYYPPRGSDFLLLPCVYCLFTASATGTSHGTPYRYDTHVPILFWGSGIGPAKISREVHTVDIAPTIARRLDVPYPSTVDGVPLKELAK